MKVAKTVKEIKSSSGSPQSGEPVFLVVGKLHRPHGVHGEMIMDVITDFPERLKAGSKVFVGEEHRPLRIKSCRSHQKGMLVCFDNFSTPEAVGFLRNWMVYVKASDLPSLPKGEYYHHQVIGMRVVDETNTLLGIVADIIPTGANDVFVISQEGGGEFLLPMVDEMVISIDLEKKEICARPMPGLIPDMKD